MRMRIGGTTYTKVSDDGGVGVWEPPLPEHVQKRFEEKQGEVLRSGQCPSVKGDTSFWKGRGTMLQQFKGDEQYLRRFAREYTKRTGKDLPADAVYYSQLADRQFDHTAVVTPAEGEAGLKRLIKRRHEKETRQANGTPVRLAEDLVRKKMREYRAAGDKTPAKQLREKVIEVHGRKV